jgi:hypothetical protein
MESATAATQGIPGGTSHVRPVTKALALAAVVSALIVGVLAGEVNPASASPQAGCDSHHCWLKVSKQDIASGAAGAACAWVVPPPWSYWGCPIVMAFAWRTFNSINGGYWAEVWWWPYPHVNSGTW